MSNESILTYDSKIKKFFHDNKESLNLFYPGISLQRIENDFQIFCEGNLSRKEEHVDNFLIQLNDGKPLEYVTGKAFFYESEFFVNNSVLIPRSETEILVETVVKELKESNKDFMSIVDVGTGSGAILLSICRALDNKPSLVACGIDISECALKVAKRNEYLLKYSLPKHHTISWSLGDRLVDTATDSVDCIVSNPPYIKFHQDKVKVHRQVDSYEPHVALYLDDDSYEEWFDNFFKQVHDCLKNDGLFMMEGHEDHLEDQVEVLKKLNFKEVELIKDYTDRKRFIKARK
tara:strand:+ start:42559 stop:43428 length:870 start_codon:yes stop_codon:yes gene_type:complete